MGRREFAPLGDALQIDMGFAWGTRPYAVVLKAGTPPPFLGDAVAAEPETEITHIDLEALADRVVLFPVDAGASEQIVPTSDSVLLVSKELRLVSIADLCGRFS